MQERTPLHRVIDESITAIAAVGPYFTKNDVMAECYRRGGRAYAEGIADVRKRHGRLRFADIIERWMTQQIGKALQQRDGNKLRVYECYRSDKEVRWQPLREMTANTLRMVMAQTRTQEREMHIKGEGYQALLFELESIGANATVDQVYDTALPKIIALRAS
jgi:hypothetical protein